MSEVVDYDNTHEVIGMAAVIILLIQYDNRLDDDDFESNNSVCWSLSWQSLTMDINKSKNDYERSAATKKIELIQAIQSR